MVTRPDARRPARSSAPGRESAKSSTCASGSVSEVTRQGEDRRVGGVDSCCRSAGSAGRAAGQFDGGVDRRLHVLLGDVDVAVERELQRDVRAAEGARRGHLRQPGHLAELPLERRGHGRGHRLGARPGVERRDHDGRVVDLRQRRDRQLRVGDEAREQQADHQQRGRDRPPDERPGWLTARSPVAPAASPRGPPGAWRRRPCSRPGAGPARRPPPSRRPRARRSCPRPRPR